MKKLNILITGAAGQLGNSIQFATEKRYDNYIFTDICDGYERLDVTANESDIEKFVKENNIDVIVNCAAYTNVNECCPDNSLSVELNVTTVEKLDRICKRYDIPLIQISSDYVFNGKEGRPYKEDDEMNQ